ncbi:hypothetical protein AVEN_208915-1 [Araneus ventricosus]|uniref:Uncharacterized protein n=1 Tax=Araneus ventricosus TaxID=182803 RepID=A0A4Y2EZR3_ARAVE|nr:hypothetical protein AVEN_208915-1 [Araneus ventricosus]
MADEVKNKIFEEMQAAEYFAILADETKDLSKKEQLSIAVRYLYDGNIHEEVLCIEELETLDAEELDYSDALELLEVLQERLNDCRTDTTMQNLWSQAANVCHDLGMHDLEESCDMQRETERCPQRAKQFPSNLKNFIVDCLVQREKLQNRGDFRRYVIYIFP